MRKRIFREAEDDTKWKMSLSKQGSLNPNYGQPRPEEVKEKIAQSMRDYWSKVPSKLPENDAE